MNIKELRKDNYLLLNYQNGRKDICKVKQIDLDNLTATLKVFSNSDNSEIVIKKSDQWDMFEPIIFDKDILNTLGFYYEDSYSVYSLHDNGAYVKFMANGNDLIVRCEKKDWVLVIRKDSAYYSCEFKIISYLHQFQNSVYGNWAMDYSNLENYLIQQTRKQNYRVTNHP